MITLIVCSYDGYSDCWDPFFRLLRKYFVQSKDFEIILSTTTKDYSHVGLNIKTLKHGSNAPWGKRLKKSIEVAKYDVVLPITEDYFLKSKVNFEFFSYLVNLIYENKEIDCIRILRYRVLWKAKKSNYKYLEEISPVTKHRFLFVPGLWRKQTLNKYLKEYENIYMSEKISGLRSWLRRDGFYSITEEYVSEKGQLYDSFNSGFVFKGKWVPWGLDFLKSENLDIDFSKRGLVDSKFMKKSRTNSKLAMLKNPLATIRSFGDVFLLLIKSFFRTD